MKKTDIKCHHCEYEGQIQTTESRGGLTGALPNRVHVHGACPSCNKTIISFFYTDEKELR